MLRFVGNVIWFVFCGGAVLALMWLLGAVIFALSIIGIPVSRAAFEMAKMSAFPFGKDVVHVRELDGKELSVVTATTGTIGFVANLIWIVTFGVWLFVGHLLAGILAFLTIIGIPFGLQSFKLAGLSLWPVGKRVVSIDIAKALAQRNAGNRIEQIRGR